ncbi:reverse transcriptase [Gossypium australe]|uniref:Reverse transcriptase n=1 Tax=Gossypium australe TaxID=47621 RepID=A0A5B6WMW7_9ROSI|nr:reverse transcriptase [Gossypium australe]
MERIRYRCGYVNGIEVDPEGARGGLCLAWKQGVIVTLRQFSKTHIDMVIDDDETRAYIQERDSHGSFVGISTKLCTALKKKGGVPRDERRMEVFRKVLAECGLMDMGFSGRWFTWERGNLPETNIRERLDRGVANEDWQIMFPEGSIQHLTHSFFDHCPLLVNTRREERGVKVADFRFEAWWIMEETFDDEVKRIWESSPGNLLLKLDKLKTGLRRWANRIQADQKKRKTFLNSRLSEILAEDRDDQNLVELIDTKIQLNLKIDKDERYWEQRVRINWLRHGDKNTVFFHSQATYRRRKNTIQKMQDENRREIENIQDIENIARFYFQNLFGSEERECCNYLLSRIKRCITEEDNQILMAPYTKEEIKVATFGMGPTKALGEDGFPAIFYQKCWHIVEDEVNRFCLQTLNEGKDFKQVNSTHIVLIPKIANPMNMKQFRPISLCNVIYKIMAKAIANRLRGVIEKCIDTAQSAFVPGRLISDNILLAYEILHTLK